MKVEVDVLGSPSLISLMVSVDVKQRLGEKKRKESRDVWGSVKVEVAFLGSPSLISLVVSVDVKQH